MTTQTDSGRALRWSMGPGGALETVHVTSGTIEVSHLGPVVIACLVVAALTRAAVFLVLLAGLAVLSIRLLNGAFFHRGNAHLLIAAGIVVGAGWAVQTLFTTMGVNGAFSRLSDGDYDNALFPADYLPLFASLAPFVLAAAFEFGDRIQRDTEGLV
jgi:hypothetical protein